MNPFLIFDRSVPITSGSHSDDDGNCSVEILGRAIYGDRRHGYHLPCIDRSCQQAVIAVTDRISDEVKQTRRWRLLIARLATCHTTTNPRVRRRSALWIARSVEHLCPEAKACNDVTERWLAEEASDEELAAAKSAVALATFFAGSQAGRAADDAAMIMTSEGFFHNVADWAVGALGALNTNLEGTRPAEEARIAWLDDFLTAHLKIMVDEGEAIPKDAEEEYLAFVAALDFEAGKEPSS